MHLRRITLAAMYKIDMEERNGGGKPREEASLEI